jgi:methylthioribose-1-phosphate isomerase
MFPNKGNVMTQCFGETIVGMMLRVAKEKKKDIKLFCPETRPYLQGGRLTASVCHDQGFDVTVITDNMPAFTMKTKGIDVFTSAADSICLDGHIVNKVGTMQIAIAAHYFGVPYFVTGIPDEALKSIDQVKIEERNPQEVLEFRGIKTTLDGVKGYYPAFDITPPKLISGVVTDRGIFSPYDLKRYYEEQEEKFW